MILPGLKNIKNLEFGLKLISKIYLGSLQTPMWLNILFVSVPTVSSNLTYNGSALSPTISSYDSSIVQVSGNSQTNAGSYAVTFHLLLPNKYHWLDDTVEDKSISWSIAPKSISGATITLGSGLTYNGNSQTQSVSSVVIDSLTATYSVSGNTGTNAGSYTLTVTGNGNFTGTATKGWSIATKSISGATVNLSATSKTFNNASQSVSVSSVTLSGFTPTYTVGGTTSATNVGTYTVTVTGSGNFSGTASATWKINKLSLTIPSLTNNSKTYNGSAQSPTVNNYNSTYETQSGTSSSTNVGSWTITWSLKSTDNTLWSDGSTSNKTGSWSIGRASVGAKPSATVSRTYNRASLNNGYSTPSGVSMTGNNSGTTVGDYTATYTPDGNHCWSDGTTAAASCKMTIAAYNISSCTIDTPSAVTYNGSAQKPTPAVKHGSTALSSSTEFTYSYSNNTNAGTATVTATGKGNYTGTKSVNFTINKATGYINLNSTAAGSCAWNSSGTRTVSSHHGGTLSVSSSNTTTCTASISSTTITITGKNYNSGTASTITVTSAATTNYTAASKTFTWTCSKTNASMTKPTAKTGLKYSGSAQTLVNAGSASGGTILYGLGSSTSSAPSSWSTSLPSGTNVGTYYVWSMVVGDGNHNDVAAAYACTVSIEHRLVLHATDFTDYLNLNGQYSRSDYTPVGVTSDSNWYVQNAYNPLAYRYVTMRSTNKVDLSQLTSLTIKCNLRLADNDPYSNPSVTCYAYFSSSSSSGSTTSIPSTNSITLGTANVKPGKEVTYTIDNSTLTSIRNSAGSSCYLYLSSKYSSSWFATSYILQIYGD